MSTHIQFRIEQEEALIYIPHGTDIVKAMTFCQNIAQYTNAGIPRCWSTITDTPNLPAKTGNMKSLNLYAHCFFRRAYDGKLYALKIHAPDYENIFNDDQEVPANIGTILAGYYSALAEEIFTFHHGALVGQE